MAGTEASAGLRDRLAQALLRQAAGGGPPGVDRGGRRRSCALCAETRTAIVPQGGNTGLCGGATPDASGTQIVLNLSRMNRVRAIDARNNTMTVEAGCVLANVQRAAREARDACFP